MLCLIPPAFSDENLCAIETSYYERKFEIQHSLLTAISVVESGKWSLEKQANTAWPWTVNAEGQGMFFASKQEAIDAVKKLQAKGIESIDVGCMQINLKYHPDAFKSLEEAFSPSANVAYGASFIKKLYEQYGSWYVAAKHYHSSLDEKNVVYGNKILAAFDNLTEGDKALEAKHSTFKQSAKKDKFKKEADNYRARMLDKYMKAKEQKMSGTAKKNGSV